MAQRILLLSAFQDYRTLKRASIQHVADGLVADGYDVAFVSTRFTPLSRRKGDSRTFLRDRANRIEIVNGVECYLWNTPFHPFATGNAVSDIAMVPIFELYQRWPDRTFDDLIRKADHIIVESSVAAIYIRRIRALNRTCQIVYYAADRLDTVGSHPYVQRRLEADVAEIDHFSLRSSQMAEAFSWAPGKLFRAGFGITESDFASTGANPYATARNAVSVGSMLFDPGYFIAVARAFPDVTFHLIGAGVHFGAPANVVFHDEMKFSDTLPFIKYATIGIAPYRLAVGAEYLAESSLKLAQYEYFALPSVCPAFAVGENRWRCGYAVGDSASMIDATAAALSLAGTVRPRRFPSWSEVSRRVLHPRDYDDAKL